MNKLMIICHARSASRFLSNEILKKIGKEPRKTHDPLYIFPDNVSVIGIIRHPVETIASNIALANFIHDGDAKIYNIELHVKKYIEIAEAILDKSDIILDYATFTKNIDKTVDEVINRFNPHKTSVPNNARQREIVDELKDGNGYLVTSKVSPNYEDILSQIMAYDLSKAYEIYNKILPLTLKY